MAIVLADALLMTSATHDLGFFLDEDGKELKAFTDALECIEVASCEDFRLTFVTDDEVDDDAVNSFAKGDLFPYRELVKQFATDLIPDGAFRGNPVVPELKKRSCPTHLVCGRLVYRRLEDYTGSQTRSQVANPVAFQPSASAMKLRTTALKSIGKMEQKLAQGVEEDMSGHLMGPKVSLHERDDAQRAKAIDVGYLVLKHVGPVSSRYRQLYDGEAITQDQGMRDAFDDIIISGLEPSVVLNYGSECFRFIHWLEALGVSLKDLSDLRVAGYIRNTQGRGKTVPGRVRNALVWLQRMADIDFGAEKVELSRMVRTGASTSSHNDPVAARMIPPEVVRLLERGCSKASTGVLRIFCGLGCLLTFGIKRWSDVQRIRSFELGEDALIAVSWKSKKKRSSFTWGALRSGFLEIGWAQSFLEALAEYGFPGEDYLIHAPKTDLMGFTKSPARWADAERGIHAALVDCGLPVDEAISFSLHSFRHLFVTAGRQLQIPEPAIDMMVGWTVKGASGMASVYDSVTASSELIYKDFVHKNFQKGWTLSQTGAIPMAPKVHLSQLVQGNGLTENSTPPKAKGQLDRKGAALQLRRMRDSPLDSRVVQCRNVLQGTVHLYVDDRTFGAKNTTTTVCENWPCGTPSKPSNGAEFADSSESWNALNSFDNFCEYCYGVAYPVDKCIPTPRKSAGASNLEECESSSSESES